MINGGPKCTGCDLDAIARATCQTIESQQALKRRLELICETWALLENAREDAKKWEMGRTGKRKRERDDEDIERLSQSSQRTTRSQSSSACGSSGPNYIGKDGNETENQRRRSGTNVESTQTCKRKGAPSSSGTTLTEGAVLRLEKRQKAADLNTMVRCWVESACG